MQWQTAALFTSARITAAAAHPEGGLMLVTSAGEIARSKPGQPASVLRRVEKQLNGIAMLSDGSFACVGANGLFLRAETAAAESIENGPDLTGIAVDPSGAICLAGRYDERNGAIYRGDAPGGPWIMEPPAAGRTGIEAVICAGSKNFIIAGQRGLLELIGPPGVKRVLTSTDHSLRALCAISPARWLVGGGGWAQKMPILLEVIDGVARPLLVAGGTRVIMGIAVDPHGVIWIAQNGATDKGWTGSLLRLHQDYTLEQMAEFPSQRLQGLAISDGLLAVYGASGFIAWQTQS